MTAIQPAAVSQTPNAAPSAPGGRDGASTPFALAGGEKSEAAPGAPAARKKPGEAGGDSLLAGLGVAVAALATPPTGAATAAADVGAAAPPVSAEPTTAPAPDAPGAAVTGRSEAGAAAADAPSSSARPAAATMAAALQAQADGLAGAKADELAKDEEAPSDDALTLGAKRLAVKGGGEAPAVGTSGVAAPSGDVAKKKSDKSKTAGEVSIGAKAEAEPGARTEARTEADIPAAQAVDPAELKPEARADRPAQTIAAGAPPSSASGVQPHGGQPSPGLHVGAQLSAGLAAQVAGEIAAHAGSRRTRFEVRLDPAELGRVDVRLDIAHDGRVQTRLLVERPETLDMLRNDSRELARTLEQAGFQLGQGGLAFQLKEGRAGLWEAAERRAGAAEGAEPVEEIAPAVYRRASVAGAGGVDMTV